ncbi:Holliday junction branch migration protein RuvA [Mycoplasma enhydrae]|uniref:Holliday junction branch migration protein RuvA n=1 Tax=Mycoplasma enhydrae TaxID=2499220 RepID=UPI00197C7AC1|nr:Holliday junction branch migration protein RuvA [Mycoplasma enhydrae]MBN4089698.1 Holliday junction branch migration protein RuvA [Mycoplasma enhydrae]
MTIYLYGKIMHVNTNYLILDHNGTGELIYTPKIERFKSGENKKIFISQIVNEYSKVTYGFEDFKEMVIFEDLIGLKGVGAKKAISILNVGWENIIHYVANENKEALTQIPGVSNQIANDCIKYFKNKYCKFIKETPKKDTILKEFKETMKMLGFSDYQINKSLKEVEPNKNVEEMVEKAIAIIASKNKK